MKKNFLITMVFGASALLLSGCSNNAATGAAIGSLVGAGIAKSTGNHKDERMAVGAMVGGIIGAGIGDAKDQAIRRQAGNTTTTTTTQAAKPAVKHVHNYASESRTHTHAGGSIKHSHVPQYYDNNYGYWGRPTINVGIGYSNGRRHHNKRHNNRRHNWPRHHGR